MHIQQCFISSTPVLSRLAGVHLSCTVAKYSWQLSERIHASSSPKINSYHSGTYWYLFVHEYIPSMITRCSSSSLFYIRHGGRPSLATFATASSSWRTLMSTSRPAHDESRRAQSSQFHRLDNTTTNGNLGSTTHGSTDTNSNRTRRLLTLSPWRKIWLRIPLTVLQPNSNKKHSANT